MIWIPSVFNGLAKVGQVIARAHFGVIEMKDDVFVAVKGARLAVALIIAPSRIAEPKEGFMGHKAHLNQLASGIVDEDQEVTARASSLEPVVI